MFTLFSRSSLLAFLILGFPAGAPQARAAGAPLPPPRYPGLQAPLKDIPALVQGHLFAATGDCRSPDSVQFQELDTVFSQQLGDPGNGGGDPNTFLAPILRVSFFDDGSALLLYRELKTVTAADGTETSTWVFSTAVPGHWVYDPNFPSQVTLRGGDGKDLFGLAFTDMVVNGQKVITAFPMGGLDRPVLKQFAPVLALQLEKDGPRLETGAAYCKL